LRGIASRSSREIIMTRISDTRSTRRLSATSAAGFVLALLLVFGTFIASVQAQPYRDDRRGWDHRGDPGHGGGGAHYLAPPVVYGGPAYYPPPVVYGPAIGIVLPGISIGIQ
jgi:hypothetical protein